MLAPAVKSNKEIGIKISSLEKKYFDFFNFIKKDKRYGNNVNASGITLFE